MPQCSLVLSNDTFVSGFQSSVICQSYTPIRYSL